MMIFIIPWDCLSGHTEEKSQKGRIFGQIGGSVGKSFDFDFEFTMTYHIMQE